MCPFIDLYIKIQRIQVVEFVFIFGTGTRVITGTISPPSGYPSQCMAANMFFFVMLTYSNFNSGFWQQKRNFLGKKNGFFSSLNFYWHLKKDKIKLYLQFTCSKTTGIRQVRHGSKEEFSTLFLFAITQVELCGIVFAILFISFYC